MIFQGIVNHRKRRMIVFHQNLQGVIIQIPQRDEAIGADTVPAPLPDLPRLGHVMRCLVISAPCSSFLFLTASLVIYPIELLYALVGSILINWIPHTFESQDC